MTERELFDAIGKVSVGHVQRALDSECPTRAQRMQRHFGNVFRYALVCSLFLFCCYVAVKLHNIENLMQQESAVTEQINRIEDNPASHFAQIPEWDSQFTGNAICEGDGGWYYAINGRIMFKDAKTGYKTELFKFGTTVLDMTYYEGVVYVLSTSYNKSYYQGKVETDAGVLMLTRVDNSRPTEICKSIKISVPIEYGEMLCHCGKIWFSTADTEQMHFYCCDLQTCIVSTVFDQEIPKNADAYAYMPHHLCGSGSKIWYLMNKSDGAPHLLYYDTERKQSEETIAGVSAYTVHDNTVWFAQGSGVSQADFAADGTYTEKRFSYTEYPYGKPPEVLFSDGTSVFVCVTGVEEGHTALYDLKTKQQFLLPQREYGTQTIAAMSGNRIYAISGSHVYMAEWNGKTLGEWQVAYSTYELDSPEVPQ